MQTRKIRPLILIFLALSLTLAACGQAGSSPTPTTAPDAPAAGPVEVGAAAPDFTATLTDGSTFTLSEQQGKAVLLNFWATWCGPCVGELPAFPRLLETYGDQLTLLAVNSSEDEKTVTDFLTQNGYTFPVAVDADGSIGALYPTDGIPYTIIIAPDGTISAIQLGAGGADEMFDHYCSEIDKALG